MQIWNFLWAGFKKHLPAFFILLLAALLFFPEALDGSKIMSGMDYEAYKMIMHQVQPLYNQGKMHFWFSHIFSGMPSVMIDSWMRNKFIIGTVYDAFESVLRNGIALFLIASFSFYALGLALRMRSAVSTIGAIAYAYSVYLPIILGAGHITKLMALAYLPGALAGAIFILDGLIIEGAILLLLAAHRTTSHQQILYYELFIFLSMGVYYISFLFKTIPYKQVVRRFLAVFFIGFIAFSIALPNNLFVLEHSKQTIRGGGLNLKTADSQEPDRKGLSLDYAFSWSQGKVETFTLLYPGIYGYGNRGAVFGESSHIASVMQSNFQHSPQDAAKFAHDMEQNAYWGDMPFTEGPVYFGVFICLLALFGAIYSKNRHLRWVIPVTVFGIFLAWGRHFAVFNELLFNYLPLYDKFRSPSMALVIPQLTFAIMAMFGLHHIIQQKELFVWKAKFFYRLVGLAGILVAVGLLLYVSLPYTNMRGMFMPSVTQRLDNTNQSSKVELLEGMEKNASRDERIYLQLLQATNYNTAAVKIIYKSLVEDRKMLFWDNIVYTVLIFGVGILLLLLYAHGKISLKWLLLILAIGVYLDLSSYGRNYFNKDNLKEKEQETKNKGIPIVPMTAANKTILQDKDPNFRVFDLSVADPLQSNHASYYHKSIGGYHAAKSSIYNDLIKYQLQHGRYNSEVINMLNTKYVIRRKGDGTTVAIRNPDALGNCWIAQRVQIVPDAKREMLALDSFDSRTTVVMQASYKEQLKEPILPYEPQAQISQTYFSNDTIMYAYKSSSTQLAVFSEIFNPYWKAYIDGEQTTILAANYVLRALQVPAGTHKITFICEPDAYYFYNDMHTFFEYLYLLTLLISSFFVYKKYRKIIYVV